MRDSSDEESFSLTSRVGFVDFLDFDEEVGGVATCDKELGARCRAVPACFGVGAMS